MNPAPPSVSICFPAYNEEKTVRSVILEAHSIASRELSDFEILVCNDGSTDATAAILNELSDSVPCLKVMTHAKNQGLTATYSHLLDSAQKDFVFLNATDGQWPNGILSDLLTARGDADIVVSIRKDKHYGLLRNIVSRSYNAIPYLLFACRTHDAGSVKLFSNRFLKRAKVLSRSPFADAERLIRAQRGGAKIVYIPVTIAPRAFGKSNAIRTRVLLQCFVDVIRLRLALWFERGPT